jgi:hypothetical protein
MHRAFIRRTALLCGVAALILVAGCRKETRRFDVSGKVTFNGKPVPVGRIYFDPDLSKKNDGLQGTAEIEDGYYNTAKGGMGTTGGPVVVRIEASDGVAGDPERPNGKPLFPYYEVQVDLPRENKITRDFDVPASAAQMKPPTPVHVGP